MRKLTTAATLALLMCGCSARVAHVTNLPPGVTEAQAKSYDSAVADLHNIADATSSLRQAVIDLRNAGVFPDDAAYGRTLLGIGKIDQAQQAASSYLRDAPEYFADPQKAKIKEIFSSASSEIQQLNAAGATGIKNPDSLKKINGMIADLTAVVNLVLALAQ